MSQPAPDWIAQSKHTRLSPTPQAYGELHRAFEHYNGALFGGAFTAIRNILEERGTRRRSWFTRLFGVPHSWVIREALELAEALHNLPEESGASFQEKMTLARLRDYVIRYPHHAGLLPRGQL